MASAEVLGVNRHAPVAFRASVGVGNYDVELPDQDAADVMCEFNGEDQEPMTGAGRDGPLGSWLGGGVRRSSMPMAAPLP